MPDGRAKDFSPLRGTPIFRGREHDAIDRVSVCVGAKNFSPAPLSLKAPLDNAVGAGHALPFQNCGKGVGRRKRARHALPLQRDRLVLRAYAIRPYGSVRDVL
jgi:hypothetical protein